MTGWEQTWAPGDFEAVWWHACRQHRISANPSFPRPPLFLLSCDKNFASFLSFPHLEPFHPAFDGPKVVAQVEDPGWLDSRKRPRRRKPHFWHWRITAAVPLVWIWQRGVSLALWAACQETQGGRREPRNRRIKLSTAKLSNSGQIHLNIWKVLWRCYHYLVRL